MADSQQQNDQNAAPSLCIQGCGFFGNALFGDMCSKCFKDVQKKEAAAAASPAVASQQPAAVDATATATTTAATSGTGTVVTTTTTTTTDGDQLPAVTPLPSPTAASLPMAIPVATTPVDETPMASTPPSAPSSMATSPVVGDAPETPGKLVQANKGRCFQCKAKVSIAKQIANKCRCDYVYCDQHRTPAHHDCTYDHAADGKALLEKNLAKLDRKGGSSFNRID